MWIPKSVRYFVPSDNNANTSYPGRSLLVFPETGTNPKKRRRARPVSSRMVERDILEKDDTNCYRLKPIPERATVKQSGKQFKGLIENAGDEAACSDKL